MFQTTHFHPIGVAQMEKVHFDAGFIGTKIRALAQRGAQNSCPVAISKLFSRCFLLFGFVGVNLDPHCTQMPLPEHFRL